MAGKGYLRIQEAAEYLSVSVRQLFELRRREEISYHVRGRAVFFSIDDLDAYMNKFRHPAWWEGRHNGLRVMPTG